MLAASWALVHSPWTSMGRIHIKWANLSRTIYQPRAMLSASLQIPSSTNRQRRYTDSIDQSTLEESSPSQSDAFRAAHVERSYSSQALVRLVAEGRYDLAEKAHSELLGHGVKIPPHHIYEKAAEAALRSYAKEQDMVAVVNWFALLPDECDSEPDAFRGIRKYLLASPEANMPLILQFGITCASKGYFSLVEKEIKPVVERFTDSIVRAHFADDVEKGIVQYEARLHLKPRDTPDASTVFEETSEDYAVVDSESMPPQPTLLSIIQESLPKRLKLPIPNDQNLFEDDSDADYALFPATTPSQIYTLNETLVELISGGRYVEAFRVLSDMQELGFDIAEASIFEKAACAVVDPLSKSILSAQDQVSQLTSWLSLIPLAHQSRNTATFSELRRHIINAPWPNLLLVIRLALILSSKGYADLISIHATPVIMHFASPEVYRQFLDDFESANKTYWNNFKPKDAAYHAKRLRTNLRGIAIRCLAYSNRIDDAMALLPDPEKDNFRMTTYSYDVLLQKLRRAKFGEFSKEVLLVQRLRGRESTSLDATVEDKFDTMTSVAQDADMVAEFNIKSPELTGENLPYLLRHLKKSLATGNSLPHPFTLVHFMDRYQSTGRSRALSMLRNKVIRTSFRGTSLFMFAEMLHYRRQGLHDLVIETFVDHFYISGVPRDEVFSRYERIQNIRTTQSNAEDLPMRFTHRRYPITLSRGKAWPSNVHCNLVWHSLLSLNTSAPECERLYQKLINIATNDQPDANQRMYATMNGHITPRSTRPHIDAVTFTPFLRRLMFGFGVARGAKMLSDMLSLGIEPNIYHFTELAGHYARLGDAPKALLVLEKLEATVAKDTVDESGLGTNTVPVGSVAASADETPTVAADPSAVKEGTTQLTKAQPVSRARSALGLSFPAPDIVLYISMMRGFLIAESLEGAEEVERRLRKRYRYVPGEDEYLDGVYTDLAALQVSLGKVPVRIDSEDGMDSPLSIPRDSFMSEMSDGRV